MGTIVIELHLVGDDLRMPTWYVPPLGLPLYWRNEVTGVLLAGVRAYIDHMAGPKEFPAPTPEQVTLLANYLRYFINAPCWASGELDELGALRRRAQSLESVSEIAAWIDSAMEIGLEPF